MFTENCTGDAIKSQKQNKTTTKYGVGVFKRDFAEILIQSAEQVVLYMQR